MAVASIERLRGADTSKAVEIADRIYWVGHHLEGDPFQCHAYLIEHGDQSVLLDPGSALTFRHTLRKVEQVVPFSKLRYFICHHQDPDITGCLGLLDQLIGRDDACIVSHWRATALLKHYGLKLPFWLVEDNDWSLDLGGRLLRFTFTPYMHFPGAFCTFDVTDGVLFSSDIFGGFTENWSLVATDEGHFEALRPFHEHYMPSRDVLQHGLSRLAKLPINLVAPQHGSLIPRTLLPYIIEKLKNLDCGLYLTAEDHTDVMRLSKLNRALREMLDCLVLYRDFRDIAQSLVALVRGIVPTKSIEFFIDWEDRQVLWFSQRNRFRGDAISKVPQICRELLGLDRRGLLQRFPEQYGVLDPGPHRPDRTLILPFVQPGSQRVSALAVVALDGEIAHEEDVGHLLRQIAVPLEVAVERERIHRFLAIDRQKIYEQSIRDSLTGMYTRVYMQEVVKRLFERHDRDPREAVAVVMFDIDHFKQVNDSFGHLAGDEVLRRVAEVIRVNVRQSDIPVRIGGEEFGVLLTAGSCDAAIDIAERIRAQVGALSFDGQLAGHRVTISAGVANREQKESLESVLRRADDSLYRAKRGGRNRVVTEEPAAISIAGLIED